MPARTPNPPSPPDTFGSPSSPGRKPGLRSAPTAQHNSTTVEQEGRTTGPFAAPPLVGRLTEDARMTGIGTMGVEDAATELAGNWKTFDSFAWFRRREIDAPEKWAVVYTTQRDSGLLDQSNAGVIAKKLEPFTGGDDPDVVEERHSHFAVGYIDGFSIRVLRGGEITPAFRVYHALRERLDNYPILDEEDYSRRESDATLENITHAAFRVKHEYILPDGWEGDVYSWLSEHNQRAVENRDDHGGYPGEDDLREAFDALGYTAAV